MADSGTHYYIGPFDNITGFSFNSEFLSLQTMPDTTPYRDLFLTAATVQTKTTTYHYVLSAPLVREQSRGTFISNVYLVDSDGNIVSVLFSGSCVKTDQGTSTSNFLQQYLNSPMLLFNGFTSADSNNPSNASIRVYEFPPPPPPKVEIIGNEDFRHLQVTMSNGQVLAIVPQRLELDEFYVERWVPTWVGAWDGTNTAHTTDGPVSFNVPPDTKSILDPLYTLSFTGSTLGHNPPYFSSRGIGWFQGDFDIGGTLWMHKTVGETTVSLPFTKEVYAAFMTSEEINHNVVEFSHSITTVLGFGGALTVGGINGYNQFYNVVGSPFWGSFGEGGSSTFRSLAQGIPADPYMGEQEIPIIREKNRLQTNSRNAITTLSRGILPKMGYDTWARGIKRDKPDSRRALATFTFTVTGDDLYGGSYLGTPATDYDYTYTRTVVTSYRGLDGVLHTHTISGSWRQIQYHLVDIGAAPAAIWKVLNYFTNFPAFSSAHGGFAIDTVLRGPDSDVGAVADFSINPGWAGYPLGVVISGYATFYTLIGNVGPYGGGSFTIRHNSTWDFPSYPIDARVSEASIQDIRSEIAPLYLQYLREMKPVSIDHVAIPPHLDPYHNVWISSSMVDGEIVTLVPFGPVLQGEDLGMFGGGGLDHNVSSSTHIAVYGKAKFQYIANGGQFSFISWTPGNPAGGPKIVPFTYNSEQLEWPSGYPANANCLVIYSMKTDRALPVAATANAETGVFFPTQRFFNGQQVVLQNLVGGTGLLENNPYYVIQASATTLKLSATSGGAPVVFTVNVASVEVVRLLIWDDIAGYRSFQKQALLNPVFNSDKVMILIRDIARSIV